MSYEPGYLFHGNGVVGICICNIDKGKVKFWLDFIKDTKLIYINVIK